MTLYLLTHEKKIDHDTSDIIILGIYTSKKLANEKIKKYKKIKGFLNYPDGFCITEYEIKKNKTEENKSVNTVFFLQHEYTVKVENVYYDYVTDIGLFLTYEEALSEMEKLKKEALFADYSEGLYKDDGGFCISEYKLNKDFWTEGFISLI